MAYEVWMSEVRREYADYLLPLSVEVAEEWGKMGIPNPLPVSDGLMAATAKVHRLTLVPATGETLPPPESQY